MKKIIFKVIIISLVIVILTGIIILTYKIYQLNQLEKMNSKDMINYVTKNDDKYYPTIKRLITHPSGYSSYYLDKQMISNKFNEDNDFYGISKETASSTN